MRTPNLDRMAAEGVKFTQYYSANPLCSPSRASLMTGRLHVRSGVNRVLFPESAGGLPAAEVTIAQELKGLGYATSCVGKWHLGHLPKHLPTTRGFDHYFGIPYSNDMSAKQWPVAYGERSTPGLQRSRTLPDIPLMRDGAVIEEDPDQTQLTRRYTAEAVDFIGASAKKKQPFFLYMPHTFPHVPLYASGEFKGKSRRGLYGDTVEELDHSVGEVLKALKAAGVEDETLVMFTSDNGPAEMPMPGKGGTGGSAGLLRGFKGSTWEGGVREPFIVRWQGKITPRTSHAFAEAYDVFPTLLAAAGGRLRSDREYDGADLGDVLYRGGAGREALHFYYAADQVRGVRKGAWKLHLVKGQAGAESAELYNLEEDPSERFNVAGAQPERVAALREEIARHVAGVKRGEQQI
jgi:arylsulfatase A-like enzyme